MTPIRTLRGFQPGTRTITHSDVRGWGIAFVLGCWFLGGVPSGCQNFLLIIYLIGKAGGTRYSGIGWTGYIIQWDLHNTVVGGASLHKGDHAVGERIGLVVFGIFNIRVKSTHFIQKRHYPSSIFRAGEIYIPVFHIATN